MKPDSIRPELEHMSHMAQHWPFGDRSTTQYGANTVELMAHWDFEHVGYAEVGEGLALSRRYESIAGESYGEIEGPREQFIARVGLVIPTK